MTTDYGELLETVSYHHEGVTTHYLGKRGWPQRTTFAGEVFRNTDLITRDGERVVIKLTDQSAVYRVVEGDEDRDLLFCERES